jgi:hypothetical protein
VAAALDGINPARERGWSTTISPPLERGMRKQTVHTGLPPERRTMGLRWGAVRRRTLVSRNDHIHLFSTENNARHLGEALRQVEEGRVYRMSLEEICARFGLGEL